MQSFIWPPQSVQRLRKGWTVRGSIPVPVLPVAQAHPTSCMMDTWCFLGTKRPGRAVDHLLAPSLRIVWRYTSISHLYIERHVMGRPLLHFFTTVLYSMDTGTRYPGGKLATYPSPLFRLRMNAAANLFHTHQFNLWHRDNLYLYLYFYNFMHVSAIQKSSSQSVFAGPFFADAKDNRDQFLGDSWIHYCDSYF